MRSFVPLALLLAFAAAPASAQTPSTDKATEAPAAPAPSAPKILNPSPGSAEASAAKAAAEPYAGQKPAPAPAAPSAAPAATATPAAKAVPAPTEAVRRAPAPAATPAEVKAAAPVPEGPAVQPIVKEGKDANKAATAPATGAQPATPTVAAKPEPPPKPTLLIAIDLTNQKLSVKENGVAKYSWHISSGRTGYLTPKGTFRPVWMSKMWYSRKYDYAPMPHSIFFHGGTAIHGTDSLGALGRPASHGCVRLAPQNAATLYRMVTQHGKQKTQITVFGTPKQAPMAEREDRFSTAGYRGRRPRDMWYADEFDYDRPPPRARRYSDRDYDAPRYYPRRSQRPRYWDDYYD